MREHESPLGGSIVAKERRLGRGLAALLGETRDGVHEITPTTPVATAPTIPEPISVERNFESTPSKYDAPVENELLSLIHI